MSEKFSSWMINPKQKKIRTTKSLSTKLESFLGICANERSCLSPNGKGEEKNTDKL